MSVVYGVTATGFVMKPFAQCLAEVTAAFQSIFGNTINMDPSQPFGQWAGIQANREFLLWQLAQACYTARDPDGAMGQGLIELCAITGTIPFVPSPSTVTAILTGTSGTVVPSGTVFATAAGVQFASTVPMTIGGTPPAWAPTTLYAARAIVTNGGNIYITLLGGTSGSSGGPTGTAPGVAVVDGGVSDWYYLGTGTGLAAINSASVTLGPQNCNLFTLNVIVTPVVGLNNVTNAVVQANGLALESDTALRTRRLVELYSHGSSNVAAITAALSALTTTTGAKLLTSQACYANDGDTTDAFGLPPHSIQAVVSYPGSPVSATDQTVAQTIYTKKAGGIQTKGAQTQSVLDTASGVSYNINFDYPSTTSCVVAISLRPNAGPSGVTYIGDAALQSALQQWAIGQSYNGASILTEDGTAFPGYSAGQTIYSGQIFTAIMEGLYGVLDVASVTTTLNGFGPDNSPKTLTRTQLPVFTFNITHF